MNVTATIDNQGIPKREKKDRRRKGRAVAIENIRFLSTVMCAPAQLVIYSNELESHAVQPLVDIRDDNVHCEG